MNDVYHWFLSLGARIKNSTFLAKLLRLLVFMIIVYGIYLAWQHYFRPPAQSSTMMTPTEAQTPDGVNRAADNARIPISIKQAKEAAAKIGQAAEPDKIVHTTTGQLNQAIQSALNASGGNFAMIVPDGRTAKEPPETPPPEPGPAGQQPAADGQPVVLKQYNIQAYPDKLTVGFIGVRSAGVAKLKKVNLPKIPLLLPKGGVGYAGPFLSVWHNGKFRVDQDSRADAGLMVVF